MDFLINRKTYEQNVRCAVCRERIYDPIQAYQSDIRLGEVLCRKCYKEQMHKPKVRPVKLDA